MYCCTAAQVYHKICGNKFVMPPNVPPMAADLIRRLLHQNPAQRLGYGPGGAPAVKAHPWFASVDWDLLAQQRLAPPQGLQDRVYECEGIPCAQFDPKPCERDCAWIEEF